jgi:hypothetical protein
MQAYPRYLHLSIRCSSHLPGIGKFFRRSSFFQNAHLVPFNEIHGFDITETDALGIAVAKVALEDHFIDDVVVHSPEGADGHTGAATDANIVINRHPAHFVIFRDGLYRTDIQAGGILALLTGHGDIKALGLPLHNFYTASCGIGTAVMLNCADEFAGSAPGAFLVIYIQGFSHGFPLIICSFTIFG